MKPCAFQIGAVSVLATLLLGACSGITHSAIKTAAYERLLEDRQCARFGFRGARFEVLSREPQEKYFVVATVEVRTSRVKSASKLVDAIEDASSGLYADAVIPPSTRPQTSISGSVNPLRPYYVFDDGRTQVLEGRVIRYDRPECSR